MNAKSVEQTYYQILEVSQTAPHHEVVAAYQRAKEAYAPDSPALYSMFSPEEAEELRKLVEEAFSILGNQNKRKEYDQILTSRGHTPTHKDLPDFAPAQQTKTAPTPAAKAGPAPLPTVSANGSVPAGYGKSKLSVYELKPDFEKEIAAQQVFDGAFFQRVRTYKNINLDQLSKETRISRSYISAIEAEDASSLPAPVFLRGFLIQLSRVLGLNENLAATSYLSRIKKDT